MSSSRHAPGSGKSDAGKSRKVAVVVLILVALVVLVPIVAGYLDDPTPAPGGVNTPGVPIDDPTGPPGIQKALKEMARREAAQRYCNAHPEAAATQRCLDGV
jgi:hypothetical protein